jgi:hypothetical protein
MFSRGVKSGWWLSHSVNAGCTSHHVILGCHSRHVNDGCTSPQVSLGSFSHHVNAKAGCSRGVTVWHHTV